MKAAHASAPSLRGGLVFSAGVHLLLAVGLFLWSREDSTPRPPVYRVELIGAPPGPRRAGVVQRPTLPAAQEPAVSGAERVPVEKTLPKPKAAKSASAPKATPSTERTRQSGDRTAPVTPAKSTAAPTAGSGAEGGKGADVANVRTDGIVFPYDGYLRNIVRQLALSWSPRRASASLLTEVKFWIRRDGSVAGAEVVKSSGDRIYDAEALGAVEEVGSRRLFRALPSGWSDDVLVVYFTFDYALRPN